MKLVSLTMQAGLVGKFCTSKRFQQLGFLGTISITFSEFTFLDMDSSFWYDCAEPVYGTMCLYNKEKREKFSEDFHFRFLPSEFQDVRA